MDPVKIAVLGGGTIGGRHIRIAASEPDCELVAIVDPDPAIRALAAETGVRHFVDLRTMLSRIHPDGVIIAVPTGLHYDIGMACIERGIHMLMEKPITGTVEEGRALINAAEAAGVRIATGHHAASIRPAKEPATSSKGETWVAWSHFRSSGSCVNPTPILNRCGAKRRVRDRS